MRKQSGYHIMFGGMEKRERERKKEQDRFWREQAREQRRKDQEKAEKRCAGNNGVQIHNSSPSLSPTENKVIETIVPIFFLLAGIGAIIVPFIFNFWTIFKIVFIFGGLFAMLMAFVGLKGN